jgi:16S rRNA (cytosine967-C5)-methyltransferase
MSSEAKLDLLRSALPEPDDARARALAKPFRQQAVLKALATARANPRFATPELSRYFRKNRSLGSRDRKAVQAAVYDIIRHEHLLIRAGARGDADLLQRWLAVLEGDRLPDLTGGDPAEDFATALSLGFRIAREWLDTLGPEEAAQLAQAQATRAPTVIRANRLLCTRDSLRTRLQEESVSTLTSPHAPDALIVENRLPFTRLDSFREGWFEVQDTSSQRFVEAIPLEPGQRVLDLCAGAGGKSLALAALGARVRAWDIRDSVLDELVKRADRASASISVGPPRPAPVVVVDAPCSGTGRLRREPALRWRLEQDAHLPDQWDLVAGAAELVEPGGILAYATCSMLKSENDPPLPEALNDEFELVDHQMLWPHRDHCDGFGWRIWRRA